MTVKRQTKKTGSRNDARKMHRERPAYNAGEGDPNPEASPKGRGFFRLTTNDQEKVVTSDAACPTGIPPKVRSRPAGHMQA